MPETTSTTDLDRLLRAHGHRVTRQRRLVWEALRGSDRHLTVDELAAEMAGDVDTASIYRTLALLEELGVARVSRFHDDDASRWESAHPDEHFHLVCTSCG
ncbi:MAG: transcriptional repressor, partial [Nitriliruptoraceae bacterium]